MKYRISVFIGVALVTEFFFNGWIGVRFYSEKALAIPELSAQGIGYQQGQLPAISADLFVIKEPRLVGQSKRQHEKEAEQRLADQVENAEEGSQRTRINADDYVLRLIALARVGKQKTALIEVTDKDNKSVVRQYQLGESIYQLFTVKSVSEGYVVLSPVDNANYDYNFEQVKLYMYNPEKRKEVL